MAFVLYVVATAALLNAVVLAVGLRAGPIVADTVILLSLQIFVIAAGLAALLQAAERIEIENKRIAEALRQK